MTDQVRIFARRTLWALPVWAVMTFIGTLTHQPDPQTAFADFAAYVTTDQFLWSHLINSILGAAVGSIGIIGLMLSLQDSKVAGKAIAGMVATITGNILTTSIFGIAAFAQPAMGRMFLEGQQNAPEFYSQVYGVPLFGTAMLGMLLFMVGGVLSGMAIAASDRFPRWAGWLYATMTFAFAISNIFLPPILTNGIVILLILATLAIAWSGARANHPQYTAARVSSQL